MLNEDEREALGKRLRRAEGQVKAIARMIEDGSYCIDVLTQIAAASAALEKVGGIVLKQHLERCVTDAFATGDEKERAEKIEELMKVFGKYSDFG